MPDKTCSVQPHEEGRPRGEAVAALEGSEPGLRQRRWTSARMGEVAWLYSSRADRRPQAHAFPP